jgi:transposase
MDMTRFPTVDHLTSWAELSPGTKESAGKRRSGKTRKGSPWLRAMLVEAAHAAGRTKDTYLGALYRRLVRCLEALGYAVSLQPKEPAA